MQGMNTKGSLQRNIGGALLMLLANGTIASCSAEPSVAASTVAQPQRTGVASPAVAKASAPAAAPRRAKAAARPAAPAFPVNSILRPDQRLEHGDYVWEAEGVPSGPLTIVVGLKAQILYAYRGGVEIGRAAILYGADDKPTPTGTFNILEKKRHHVSNLYGAPMPYMMRLTWDGVAIHGSEVEWGSATHGCVGLPAEFAALLFAEAKKGDPVLVTNRWRTDLYGV
jgi:lipoprotein-anchoring transpeptidase ErfK/SrfK